MDCVLCEAQNEKYRFLIESDYTFAVLCKYPVDDSHVMVLPKRHVIEMTELTPKEMQDFWMQVQKVRVTLEKVFPHPIFGLRNYGRHQSQAHYHFHLISSEHGMRDMYVKIKGGEKYPPRSEARDMEIRDMLLCYLQK